MAADKGNAQPPPADLASRTFPLRPLPAAGPSWHRIGKTRFAPGYFSNDSGWRFSREDMPGVLYLGDSPETCFWEVFWDDWVTRPPADRRLDRGKLEERSAWEVALPAPLRVVDTLDAKVLRALGAHGGTFLGPYVICQAWAKALREHKLKPDGIRYESARNKGSVCLALFAERCEALPWRFGKGRALMKDPGLTAALSATDGLLPPSV
ncbi:RES family NAD+ phosphorylase [Nibricoccus sp. IMCC34717]|uniref:RES family NAD+ phosphorylase n=1 Tax=Nibricoccus sp. IMCC34717 TaxID=3034021 RepID=UPI00384CAD36